MEDSLHRIMELLSKLQGDSTNSDQDKEREDHNQTTTECSDDENDDEELSEDVFYFHISHILTNHQNRTFWIISPLNII
jgi:hypothetical protein